MDPTAAEAIESQLVEGNVTNELVLIDKDENLSDNDSPIPIVSNPSNGNPELLVATEVSKTIGIFEDAKPTDNEQDVAVCDSHHERLKSSNDATTTSTTKEEIGEIPEKDDQSHDSIELATAEILDDVDVVATALEGLIVAEVKIESQLSNREQNSDELLQIIMPEKENVSPIPLDVKEKLADDLKKDPSKNLSQNANNETKLDEQTTNKDFKKHEKWYNIHPMLLDYDQCFFNWIPNDNPLTLEESDIILQVLASKYENITGPLVDKFLKWCPVEIISQHLIVAFIHLIKSKLVEATADLNKVADLIKRASVFISIDFIEGFVYLFTGLEALKRSLAINSCLPGTDTAEATKDLELFVAKSTKFKDLPKLAQVLVKGARVMFVGSRRLNQEELNMIKDVIVEDPDTVEWLTNLIGVSRTCRKELDYRAGPSEEELLTLLRAIELNENHVMVKLYLCMYLSDVIKSRTWDPQSGTLMLGDFKEFTSIKEVVDFIKIKANEIIRVMDCCGKINLGIADIFGFMLPFEHRDAPLAKKCLGYALIYNPKSSKANHKMGLLILTVEKNVDDAKMYIKAAFSQEPRNFSALIDVIHTLLHQPKENAEELRKIFDEQIKPQLWSPKRLAGLQFTKAIHHYMLGAKDAAVRAWITMYQTDPESTFSFKQLSYCTSRYLWNRRDVSIASVYENLMNIVTTKGSSLKPVPNSQEFDIIVRLFEVVEFAKSEDDIRFGNKSQYRGGMRGGGNYSYGNRSSNNSQQGSSHQGRGNSTFRGRGSNTSHSNGRWRGQDEGSSQQNGDRAWRNNGTSQSDNQRKKPFEKKSENETNKVRDPTNPSSESGRGFHSKRGRGNNRGGRGKGNGGGNSRGGSNAAGQY